MMKCKFLSAAFLAFVLLSGCATQNPGPLQIYSVKELSKDAHEKLYAKNGNLICASQRLSLASTQLVSKEVDGIPESIDLGLSRFNCEKPETKDEMCRVDIYTRMNQLTDFVNRELKNIAANRLTLRQDFYRIAGNDGVPTSEELQKLDDEKKKQSYQILKQDRELKKQATLRREEYENRMDGLEEMIYGCNY